MLTQYWNDNRENKQTNKQINKEKQIYSSNDLLSQYNYPRITITLSCGIIPRYPDQLIAYNHYALMRDHFSLR